MFLFFNRRIISNGGSGFKSCSPGQAKDKIETLRGWKSKLQQSTYFGEQPFGSEGLIFPNSFSVMQVVSLLNDPREYSVAEKTYLLTLESGILNLSLLLFLLSTQIKKVLYKETEYN